MSQEINKEIIQGVLGKYKPDSRHMVSTGINSPNNQQAQIYQSWGEFLLKGSKYIGDWPHATTIQSLNCVNQLSYVTFAQLIKDKKITGLENLSLQKFLDNMDKITTPMVSVRFNQGISPARMVLGEVNIGSIRKRDSIYISKVDFSLKNAPKSDLNQFSGNMLFVMPGLEHFK